MKPNSRALTPLLLLIAVAAIEATAQQHTHHKLIDLGTFGGPQSYVYTPNNYSAVLNNRGKVTGWAETKLKDHFQKEGFVSLMAVSLPTLLNHKMAP